MICSIHNEYLTVSAEDTGAELSSIKDANGLEYLWQGDEKYWAGRAPILFPYVARLFGGRYSLDGQEYEMNIHGFARRCTFECKKLSESAMEMHLSDTAETYAQYPRHFGFTVGYALRGKTLEVSFKVENRDSKTMYFGLGGHPGFNVPLVKGKPFEDYRLRFEEKSSPERVIFDETCFVTGTEPYELVNGTTIPLTRPIFDNDAIVLTDISSTVTLEADEGPSITAAYPGMKYIGFWQMPHKDAPYLCIEPWCSLPSDAGKHTVFEEKKDLLSLAPGEIYTNLWTITVNN